MCFSFYDNQEAGEASLALLFCGTLLSGWSLAALFVFYQVAHAEEEERILEEDVLDTSEPTLNYTLSVHYEEMVQSYGPKEKDYGEDSMHAYFAEDYDYERAMLWEIYEFHTSTILSNNAYAIPADERSLYLWLYKILDYSPIAVSQEGDASTFLLQAPQLLTEPPLLALELVPHFCS